MLNRIVNKLVGLNSVLHAYDYLDTNDGWVKEQSPVIRLSDIYFDPYVYKFNDKYHMYVSNRTRNAIELFMSEDGITWEKVSTCINGTSSETWDSIVNRACVVQTEKGYLMFYTGQHNGTSKIGLATSADGLAFTRFASKPVIFPEFAHEKDSVMNPCVIWNSKKEMFQMWYSSGEFIEPDVICYAESKDGIDWKKWEQPVLTASVNKYDRAKVGGCDVHVMRNRYIMYYIGYQDVNIGRICVASSDDGIHWKRDESNPIISPSKDSWDAHSVYKPSVIYEKDRIMLWYNGRKGYVEKIGLARKTLKD